LLGFAGIIQFAIPTFLFVSGFYIAIATGRNKSTLSWNVVLSRIKFLLIPYLVWFSIISVVLFLDGTKYAPIQYVRLLLTGYIQGPYYFVPMLIQLYLLAPFLVPFAKSNWKLLLILATLLQLLTQILLYFEIFQVSSPFQQFHVLPIWLSLTRMFWFVLGIVLGFHIQSFKTFLERTRWLFFVLLLLFLLLNTFERHLIFLKDIAIPVETTIGSLYALSFIFVILGFSNIKLPLTSQIERIGSKSFGIYLTHASAQQYSAKIIYHIAPWLIGYPIIFTVIIFAIGLAVPNILMESVRRSPISRYYQFIFG
jgi:peptidoglycan/LPS O-acetylase OafA/YrhL